jgi:hypothetical protein
LNKHLLLILVLLSLGLTLASAQTLSLTPSSVNIDGLISDKEYALTVPLEKMTVYVRRTADTLFLGLSAQTKGWVALGFGSERMDGARLFIGTVIDGTASLSQQLGKGHGHREISDNLTIDYAIVEDSGRTTLEIALKTADAIAVGQTELQVLAAFGSSDQITAYHSAREPITFQLQ